jgi:peptidoglycan/xylan/chitin deacetylase (PgdA/CDA1 family)
MHYPILLYHGIDSQKHQHVWEDEKGHEWTINAETFRRHLEIVHDAGYDIILLRDLFKLKVFRKPLIITFDDGQETDYTNALPILQEFGYRAEFFVNSGTIGKKNYMSINQLKEMKNAGMSIQSHGHTHSFLTMLGDNMLIQELAESKRIISDIILDDVEFLSYPGGRFDDRTESFVRRAGYKGSLTGRGYNKWGDLNLYGLKRQGVHASTSERLFRAYIKNDKMYFLRQDMKRVILLWYRIIAKKLSA